MLGSLVALDTILFYVFWEVMLVPMYFIIGIWGGKRRIYATMKFFLFTMAGSLLMFVAILFAANVHLKATGFQTLLARRLDAGGVLRRLEPDAGHRGAPLRRVRARLPREGAALAAPHVASGRPRRGPDGRLDHPRGRPPEARDVRPPALRVSRSSRTPRPGTRRFSPSSRSIGIVYGAWVAAAQKDMKKLVAYSSVSHLALVVLGIVAGTGAALSGAIFQMVGHGLTTGLLFLLVGVLYERRHTREMADYGGVAARVPVTTTLFLIATLGSVGPPRPERLRRRVPDPRRRLPGERRLARGRGHRAWSSARSTS